MIVIKCDRCKKEAEIREISVRDGTLLQWRFELCDECFEEMKQWYYGKAGS
jgi:formate dehydrogenase maturation protein FdhE